MMVGVLLAGGRSKRMGSPKALKRDRGESFMAHGIRHLWAACDVVVVVLGAHAKQVRMAVEEEFERLVARGDLTKDLHEAQRHGARGLEVRFVTNKEWRKGMLSSVRVGLRAALRLKPTGLLVQPIDHPGVKPRTIGDLATVLGLAIEANRPAERKRFAYALVPRYQRKRGHPIAMSPVLAKAVAADAKAHDLSDAVRRNTRLLGYLDVRDAAVTRNRNTPRA